MMISGNTMFPNVMLALLIWLLHMGARNHNLIRASPIEFQCLESERDALLKFKESFTMNPSGHFSSWILDGDCCQWRGVGCDNSTGHVIALTISNQDQSLISEGEFVASLSGLPFLSYLDLSGNNFHQVKVPNLVGSFASLEHLNLSNANFKGPIPDELGNLSRLQSVDLSDNSYSLVANSLHWLHGLSSLEVLDLGGVDLSVVSDWLNSVNMLPSLVQLDLRGCRLKNLPPSLPSVNFTTLEVLDLSVNDFNSSFPIWISNTSQSLNYLNISGSQLRGTIPDAFGDMISLVVLDLSKNQLEGKLSATLGLDWTMLRELYLSQNRLFGSLERIISQLSNLVVLDLASNSLGGTITEVQLMDFNSLRVLDLSSNHLSLKISSGWVPLFQLDVINLRACNLGPRFPGWLQSQKGLLSLDISNATVSGNVPDWFWNLSNKIQYMNLSWNHLSGRVPDLSSKANLSVLDLTYNEFEGHLPLVGPSMVSLLLYGNFFSGSMSSICEILVPGNSLSQLDLFENNLSGEIPDCWTNGKYVTILILGGNNFSGHIPNTIGHLTRLKVLDLSLGYLSGGLPPSLRNCSDLSYLRLRANKLSGRIPVWIVELQHLKYLSLDDNRFEGNIPWQLCSLKSLRRLALSSNFLSGVIPSCINNFLAMSGSFSTSLVYDPFTGYADNRDDPYKFFIVGIDLSSNRLSGGIPKQITSLTGLQLINLSGNNLSGGIPKQITSLTGLQLLNLSGNSLSGTIPDDIGRLQQLLYLDLSNNELSCTVPPGLSDIVSLTLLDLSRNRLSGDIPIGMGSLRGLDTLNLSRNELSCTIPTSFSNLKKLYLLDVSHNKLSGKIPRGNWWYSKELFVGNRNICGRPFANACSANENYEEPECANIRESACNGDSGSHKDEDDDRSVYDSSFYISVGLGFAAGLWCLVCPLVMSNSWRRAYYEYLGNLYDKVYVIIVVYVIRRRF